MKKRGDPFHFEAIGVMRTPFKDKFGIPRQPGLAAQAKGVIKIAADPDLKTALRSLDEFSHLWIVFVFHEHGGRNWKPSIRPPRLGGQRKVGVLSSRSPHRPNPIGLSAVRLERIDLDAEGGAEIHVAGVDLLDGTPVLDIKPYLPYADSIPEADAGWAATPIARVEVRLSASAGETVDQVARMRPQTHAGFRDLIVQILELDPRPAFQKHRLPPGDPAALGTRYGFEVLGYDVKYEIGADYFLVTEIILLESGQS